ncbi:hypothetical protein MOE48_10745 [Bacillus inaquosorum]|uniref:hypothetical protein n=1 Tax=Bacillus inaquosorum TaxID=483913 RepID=UPI00227F340F|nr:hypothetical protein [Bacillus inaquosorum]MCY9012465.1 hypothetical protein [Bacillus inaquosorum]MCY9041776.1 hypothetical protein [Bacillus inaquosorum]MCY9096533.1 hypothetical protein [Bacillus inaquosorum]MCY9104956.1 hypothetical protein [Bacillus inaquosorum]MCY9123342.1 hypothetical protein [Bacillus inaquosorum]
MFSGEASDVQIAAFLIAERLKTESPDELLGITEAMRAYSSVLQLPPHIGGHAMPSILPGRIRAGALFSPPFLRLFYSREAAYRYFSTAATGFRRNMQQAEAKTGPKVIGTMDIRLLQRDYFTILMKNIQNDTFILYFNFR